MPKLVGAAIPEVSSVPTAAEFDKYAKDYLGGADNWFKRLVGGSLENFIAVKVDWLLDYIGQDLPASVSNPAEMSLLDFGCGTGEMLQQLRRGGFRGRLDGCDVSQAMLAELVLRWDSGELPRLHITRAPALGLQPSSFDLVLACCVFHHIPRSERCEVFRTLKAILKPGGRLVVFEHNPRNPLTRFVISRTSIDRDAVLLDAAECKQAAAEAGLLILRADHMLFFPPRFKWTFMIDRWLRKVPIGGQYAMVSQRPPDPAGSKVAGRLVMFDGTTARGCTVTRRAA